MKLGDIKGESVEANHREWSDILSVSQSVDRLSTTNAAGGVSSTARSELVVVKEIDKSSPKIMEAVCLGTIVPVMEVDLTRTFGDSSRVVFLKYELRNVQVTSYQINASGQSGPVPTESFSLNFEEIKVTYTQFDSAGRKLGEVIGACRFELGKR